MNNCLSEWSRYSAGTAGEWGIWVLHEDIMKFTSYCSVSCVTSAVEKKSSFLGSSFNFSGTTSSGVRHTDYFPAKEIKSSVGSTVRREASLDCTSQGVERSCGISFCIIKRSLHCQVWRARRMFGEDLRIPPHRVLSTLVYNRPDPRGPVISVF